MVKNPEPPEMHGKKKKITIPIIHFANFGFVSINTKSSKICLTLNLCQLFSFVLK